MKGCLFRTFNSYSFNFNGGICNCSSVPGKRAVSVNFEKQPYAISLHFLLFDTNKPFFLDVLNKEYYSLYLFQNINLYAMKFYSECPEEVIIIFDAQCINLFQY